MIKLDRNKRYLITGGTGFLGRALIGRLKKMGIEDIIVIARNEGKLVELHEEFPYVEIKPGDIADPYTCAEICSGVRGVIHTAASKHVTMAQTHVKECVSSNVIGTLNLLNETLRHKPDFIVGVSTDKASIIRSVYGATKYLQERLFIEYEGINKATAYRTVRFGNVWGSTGSFITKWKSRMQAGAEIIITDPEATRFFFTIDQAADLVFNCLKNAPDSAAYIPKMKAVKMGTVLEACMEVYGKCPVKTIGLQAGENLHESIDGVVFSNQVEQFTKAEVIQTFLR